MRKLKMRARNSFPLLVACVAGLAACCFATAGYAAGQRAIGQCTNDKCSVNYDVCGLVGVDPGVNVCDQSGVMTGDICPGEKKVGEFAPACFGVAGICLANNLPGPYICTKVYKCSCQLVSGVLTCVANTNADSTQSQAGACSGL